MENTSLTRQNPASGIEVEFGVSRICSLGAIQLYTTCNAESDSIHIASRQHMSELGIHPLIHKTMQKRSKNWEATVIYKGCFRFAGWYTKLKNFCK